ncbi:MAG TPA: acetoin dehydrogenase dihydrolipoyllysine-residue acetyltransferase subunit [Acidiphilium sp.]|jgi:pyruvate dehydrogenase E2 component (dihydrolipoamide acetyltransferase)|uniref:acetoin dehydrogenase dihydrolipoyllysine-residue acetyltransferase subunit n=1 Tax=unclassified Acidiphilium TaxID=2617493 RepID=UPI000BCF0109|nr:MULTISPECIES: acetoin dehydrogenase dihydrolipoyllysine-residue acetyltransferase subunit [unclassified Acidiphilium]OYV56943.1 MAG: acetoin dehydrogenase dihydrolipoyllysine-residue acetyltransferase subunit [Acidiphilium sp. 20-67-58]HQT60967.1 acetoin dehydrogenase dihydrolipoyllysine-residue acetyltransferase subunit [Acidiphilium sp.]HQU11596.1 acetoin dehydrogenase dihydrolipoyllysine-residue acetyltransferase subunit [Acidiphilium sp.]
MSETSGEIRAVTVPKWGLAMEEGTLTAWLAGEGATIAKGQELAEIESTKIANVLESPAAGVLRRQVAQPGQVLPVGALLGVIAPAGVPDADIDAFVAGFVVDPPDEEGAEAGLAEGEAAGARGPIAYKAANPRAEAVPAILVHGFGGDSDNFMFNIEALAADRPVYAIDLPGHGRSAKAIGSGDMAELAGAILALMDAVDAPRAHLVGHSLGAAACFEVASQAPERVASLAGVAPAGLGPTVNDAYISGFLAAERRKDVKAALQMLFADPDLVSAAMIEGVQRALRLDGAREALSAIAAATLPGGSQARNYRAMLGATSIRTLVLWGERDAILPPEQGEGLPDAVRLVRVPAVGHMPHMEAAALVNEQLAAHFAAG